MPPSKINKRGGCAITRKPRAPSKKRVIVDHTTDRVMDMKNVSRTKGPNKIVMKHARPPPRCNDAWCLNGNLSLQRVTYWLCNTCKRAAADVFDYHLSPLPLNKILTPHDRVENSACLLATYRIIQQQAHIPKFEHMGVPR